VFMLSSRTTVYSVCVWGGGGVFSYNSDYDSPPSSHARILTRGCGFT
jgi:hypothetical protein